ncbi:hypothetical protein G9A89_021411 [Geosiphon pyriformis]|nr:hypothetical protein G9A89_021411 [Geosiphon pyriformis]
MAYALIMKLNKFNGKEDNIQVWLNDMAKAITANNWDDTRTIQAIPYFLQNTVDAWKHKSFPKSVMSIIIIQLVVAARDARLPQLCFLVTSENATSNNQGIEQQQPLTNNILFATITKNESLDTIFPFELEEPSDMSLFSGASLKEKPIMAIYTNAKIDGHSIKLILDSDCRVDCAASARIITVDGATKTPIGEIDDFPIEVNGIVVPIKVLVMEATQYQARKQKRTELTWNADQAWDTNHNLKEPPIWKWDKREKGKGKNTLEDQTE